MKNLILLFAIVTLAACGGGDSSSGGGADPTLPGSGIPANFVGVYVGSLTLRVSAAGISQTDSFPITITVTSDGQLRFDGDDPSETITVGVTNEGQFVGNLQIEEDECEGTIEISGTVDGVVATGTVSGDGQCDDGVINASVELSGSFSATK